MAGIIEKHVAYTSAITRINEIEPRYFKNLRINYIYDNLKNFRIVQIENGDDRNWYLLIRRKNIISRFFGLFTKEVFQWYIACGYDRGTPGCYSYQSDVNCNGVSHIIHTIPDILRAYIGGKNRMIDVDREGFPRGEILKELDIEATLTNLKLDKEKDVFHALLECSVLKDYKLDMAIA